MNEKQRKIRIIFYVLCILSLLIIAASWIGVTFFDTPGWLRIVEAFPLIFCAVFWLSPWGKMIRSLPEERAKKTPQKRMILILAATLSVCGVCWWIGYQYTVDWKYRADAAKAKELYWQGDYKAATPYIHKSFVGQDSEVWYMVAVNSLAAPQNSPAHQTAEECLQKSAEAGFEPAVKLWNFYRQIDHQLSEKEKYLAILNCAAKNGDKSAKNMLADWKRLEQNTPQTELHIASGKKAVEQMKNRFPQCLAGFRRIPLKPIAFPQGHGAAHLEYALHCPCGGKHFTLGGFRITDEKEQPLRNFLPPLSLSCRQCKKTIPLFDDSRDGYDAQFANDTAKKILFSRQEKREPSSLKGDYEIIVSLEYGLTDDALKPGTELEKKLPDSFTWISIYGIGDDGKLQLLFDWECA